jgi:shikimate 5-dehydrogenase
MTGALAQPKAFSFIGVTTSRSAIMKVFPMWAEHLGERDVRMIGIDLPIHADPQSYRDVVEKIKAGGSELGGLVTTHKLDLFGACRDLFDYVDPFAELLGEVSALSKREDAFRAHAKDPISSGRALDQFIEPGHWCATEAKVLLFGAGGSNSAISLHLLAGGAEPDRPRSITIVDVDAHRLRALRDVHERLGATADIRYVENSDPLVNDGLMTSLPAGSLVVNGTGMGKDVPGSPVTDDGLFPERGLVWELNYRGALGFLRQAGRQREERELLVEDGWNYFVHGWTCALEEVLDVEIDAQLRSELARIALLARQGKEGNASANSFASSYSRGPDQGASRPGVPRLRR